MSATTTTAFDRATTVRTDGDHRVVAAVDPRFSAPTGPNGGYLAAILVRALEAAVDPRRELRLRSLTCHYLRSAAPGELVVEVDVLRVGRRLTSVSFRAVQAERTVLAGIAAYAAPGQPTAAAWAPAPPEVAPPPSTGAGAVSASAYRRDTDGWLEPPETTPGIIDMVRLAPRLGGVPFSGRAPRPGNGVQTGGWVTLPEPRRVDAAWVAQCTDVWWPPSFEALDGPAIAPTIDLTIHVRADIPPDGLDDQPLLGVYRSTAATEGFVEEDGVVFLADGTLVAQSRQLALLAPMT